jgi:hypothetical protein
VDFEGEPLVWWTWIDASFLRETPMKVENCFQPDAGFDLALGVGRSDSLQN